MRLGRRRLPPWGVLAIVGLALVIAGFLRGEMQMKLITWLSYFRHGPAATR